MLRRQKHACSQSTTPFACTLLLRWRSTPRKSVDVGFRTIFSSIWANMLYGVYAFVSVILTQCFLRTGICHLALQNGGDFLCIFSCLRFPGNWARTTPQRKYGKILSQHSSVQWLKRYTPPSALQGIAIPISLFVFQSILSALAFVTCNALQLCLYSK